MIFEVTKVIDGDTFEVSPNWTWEEKEGNAVRPNGYDTPEKGKPGYEAAKDKLTRLIYSEEVELDNAIKTTYGRLLCDVYHKGTNLADYFHEYK